MMSGGREADIGREGSKKTMHWIIRSRALPHVLDLRLRVVKLLDLTGKKLIFELSLYMYIFEY